MCNRDSFMLPTYYFLFLQYARDKSALVLDMETCSEVYFVISFVINQLIACNSGHHMRKTIELS